MLPHRAAVRAVGGQQAVHRCQCLTASASSWIWRLPGRVDATTRPTARPRSWAPAKPSGKLWTTHARRFFTSKPETQKRQDTHCQKAATLPEAALKGTPHPTTPAGPAAPKFPLTKSLHEDIYTLPNILTLSRLAAAPFVGYLILYDQHAWALGLLGYSGVTDLLDGWIARRWNQKTVVGTVLDPMADKALMAILTVALAAKGALPMWLGAIILGRDAGLGMAAVYYRWISLPPPKTFARYWDFSLPSAEVHPTTISKYNTFLQLALIGLTTAAPVVSHDLSTPLSIMQYVVAATTIWSGASYVYTKDAVKILKAPQQPPK